MKGLVSYLRANPQAAVLLAICVVLGIGTFIAVLISLAGSGTSANDGYSSAAVLGLLS